MLPDITKTSLTSGKPTYDKIVHISGPALTGTKDATFTEPAGRATHIGDVARIAGVAPITVSRALREPDKVSAEKRERIRQAIRQTGYRTNPYASALRSGRANIILAFVSNFFSPQFTLAVSGCGKVIEEAGYQFLVGQTYYSCEKETAIIKSLQTLRPAAVMFTGVIELEENRQSLKALGIPVMETWAYPRDPIDLLVGFSNTDAGRIAAEYLSTKGYRQVAYIGQGGARGALRLNGFRNGCCELGMVLRAEIICDNVQSIHDGRQCLSQLMEQAEDVEAVFCSNDLLAVGALIEARERKLAVPSQLAIAGFGECDMAGELSPGLTTIGIDSVALGHIAGEMLLKQLAGKPIDTPAHAMELILTERGSA